MTACEMEECRDSSMGEGDAIGYMEDVLSALARMGDTSPNETVELRWRPGWLGSGWGFGGVDEFPITLCGRAGC